MSKQVIAVDIDDVLAAEAEFIVEHSNKHWGHTLTLDDYHEHWPGMWGTDFEETERRADVLHQPGISSQYRIMEAAREILTELSQHFKLIVVTSRRSRIKDETLDWLQENFGEAFTDVHFTGFYDAPTPESYLQTKGELLKELSADFLIDDQLKHCKSAVDQGLRGVLFGDYAHTRSEVLPKGVVRCKDWWAVQEYFDGLK